MTFMDKMRQKAEEFDLETKAKKLQEAAAQAAHQAREKAGELATDNRDKIDSAIGKASSAIDERTEGKYSDRIAKVKDQVNRSVDTVAKGDQSGDAGTDHPGAAADAASADLSDAASGGTDPVNDSLTEPVIPADSPTPSAGTPSSVNPPEVSEPQAGHPAPGVVPGTVPGPVPTPPKTPGPPTT